MSCHGDVIEASVDFPGLRVTVSGTPAKVADFLRFAASYPVDRARSPAPSVGSFELLSEVPEASAAPPRTGLETRDQISASFLACPAHHLALGIRLSGASLSGRDRVARAWTAGLWAKAVLEGRVFTPNRTPPLDLRSHFYAWTVLSSIGPRPPNGVPSGPWKPVGPHSPSPPHTPHHIHRGGGIHRHMRIHIHIHTYTYYIRIHIHVYIYMYIISGGEGGPPNAGYIYTYM